MLKILENFKYTLVPIGYSRKDKLIRLLKSSIGISYKCEMATECALGCSAKRPLVYIPILVPEK